MQLIIESPDETMAVSDSRFDKLLNKVDGIAEQVNLVRERLAKIEGHTEHRPTLQTLLYVLGTAAAVALIAYLGWAGVQITNESSRLTSLETNIRFLMAASSPSAVLEQLRVLTPKALSHNLPALKKVAEQPANQVKPDVHTIREITVKLRDVSISSPDYWPTLLRFIQFASDSLVKPSDVPPPGRYMRVSQASCVATVHCFVMSNAAIELDGGSIPNSIFYHCRIKFTDNPVDLKGCQFKECVFEMPSSATPTPYLKKVATTLLAGGITEVKFNSI